MRDLVARFVQTSHVASLGRKDVSSGRVWVERPGRMRWEYQEPEPHTIAIADGALHLYSPSEGQLQIASLSQGAFSPTALDFLLGDGRLADTFRAEARGTTDRGELRLRLVPKSEARFQELELWVAPDTHQLRGSVVVDQLGNRTEIRFEDIVENGGIDAARFRVEVPAGTEIIDLR